MLLEQVREMIAQNRARRGEPQTLGGFASQTRTRFFEHLLKNGSTNANNSWPAGVRANGRR